MTGRPVPSEPIAPPVLAPLRTALERGDQQAAFGCFQTLLAAKPGNPDFRAWIERGWTVFATGDEPDELLQDMRSARTDEVAALLLFARVASGSGHAACALDAGRAARTRAPDRAEPVFLLCALLLRAGDPEAGQVLDDGLARFPQPSRGWGDLGTVLLGLKKPEAALVCFARALPSVTLTVRRGTTARDLGRLGEARAAFAEAVRIDPKHARAWFLLGTCAQDGRDLQSAADAYARVLALDPQVAEAAVNLGTVLQEMGDLESARAAYARAVGTRADTFGRVAQALSTSPRGELWLDLGQLRRSLTG